MVVYECEYMVDSRDIDPWYHCRPSGLMGMLQEAATQAASWSIPILSLIHI